jgi:hypothetical protein
MPPFLVAYLECNRFSCCLESFFEATPEGVALHTGILFGFPMECNRFICCIANSVSATPEGVGLAEPEDQPQTNAARPRKAATKLRNRRVNHRLTPTNTDRESGTWRVAKLSLRGVRPPRKARGRLAAISMKDPGFLRRDCFVSLAMTTCCTLGAGTERSSRKQRSCILVVRSRTDAELRNRR